jgi:hypothetical protein
MGLINAVSAISVETGSNWHTVLLALCDRGLIDPIKQKEIEEYFFNKEDLGK